jgi:hypothetical protein
MPDASLPEHLVARFLDLSAGHLRQDTFDRLDQFFPICAARTDCGWWMAVPDLLDESEVDELPDELVAVIRLAHRLDCSHVNFDVDGQGCAALDAFEWSRHER